MHITLTIIVIIVATQHLFFLWLEMFAWTSFAPKVFRNFSKELFPKTKSMAANQGLYNGFLAAGLIWSLLVGNEIWSLYIAMFFLGCVLIAGIYGAYSISIRVFYVQGMPAAIGLILALFIKYI